MPESQRNRETDAYDFDGNVHKDLDSYLLSVGQNQTVAANIDPESSVGRRMNALVEREEEYNRERIMPVSERSSRTIMRQIKENYSHLVQYGDRARQNENLEALDFSGLSHSDPKTYLRSVMLDRKIEHKLDFQDKELHNMLEPGERFFEKLQERAEKIVDAEIVKRMKNPNMSVKVQRDELPIVYYKEIERYDKDGNLNKYFNNDMQLVMDNCRHLEQLQLMSEAQRNRETGAYDFNNNVHKDLDSYLLSVGQNRSVVANIDPESSIAKRMNALVRREEQYNREISMPVSERSSSTIMRQIKENYNHLVQHEEIAKKDKNMEVSDFRGISHNDPKGYLRSVMLDKQVANKIDYRDKELHNHLDNEISRAYKYEHNNERGISLGLDR